MSPPKFDSAKFYDCLESEELTHSDVAEALEEFLEMAWEEEDGESRVATIQRLHAGGVELTVQAYNPRTVDKVWIDTTAEWMAEELGERFLEEFGGPDSEPDTEAGVTAKLAAEALVRAYVATAGVWQCEMVAERTYTEAEALEILGES